MTKFNSDTDTDRDQLARCTTSRVRVVEDCDDVERPDRRTFLQALAAQGMYIPAGKFLFSSGIGDVNAADLNSGDPRPEAARSISAAVGGRIIRDFADPYIELVKLLHEAGDVEHALMVQYLYAAFSVKRGYAAIAGNGASSSNDLIGVAVQEMRHLAQVNALLVELGASPHLLRQDFPFEPNIYPFEFRLEPLSRKSLAKYVYAEAPADALDRAKAVDAQDRSFLDTLNRELGTTTKRNHVGSLYTNIIRVLDEYTASSKAEAARLKRWTAKLEAIKREGEDDHFNFFKRLFTGVHPGFAGHPSIWSLSPDDPAYPARQIPVNPSALVGNENQIKDPVALGLAWLGNLHYWIILLLVDLGYRSGKKEYADIAKLHMLVPFLSLARHLPTLGAGMPFDSLGTGYAPGGTNPHSLKFVTRMVDEADKVARSLEKQLPTDYPISIGPDALGALARIAVRSAPTK